MYDPVNEEYGFRLDAKVKWQRRPAAWWVRETLAALAVTALVVVILIVVTP